MALLVGIFKIFIALYPYRRAQAWSWWTVLSIGVIACSFMLIYSSIVGDPAILMVTIIGIILFLIALLLPAKAMLIKKKN